MQDQPDSLATSINQWLRKLQQFIENHSAIYILVGVLSVGFVFFMNVVKIADFIGPGWKPIYTPVTVALVIVALLLVDYKHVRMLHNRMLEITKRDQHIKSLTDAMTFQTERIEVPYTNYLLRLTYDIHENGDGHCIREAIVTPIDRPIYLLTVITGATDNVPGLASTDEMNLVIYSRDITQDRTFPILHYLVADASRSKRHCIVLDSPIALGEKTAVIMSWKWPKLWTELITKGEDKGNHIIEHDTTDLEICIKAPPRFEISAFVRTPNNVGDYSIDRGADSRSTVTWKVGSVKRGTRLHYRILGHLSPS